MSETEGKTISCKAAVIYELNGPIKVESVNVLPPTPGHVRIKMVATALCQSDLSIMTGDFPNQKLPYIPGHEGAGVVESVGEGVTSVTKGDKVFTLFMAHCGICPPCKIGKSNICFDFKRKPPTMGQLTRNEGLDGLSSYTTKDGQTLYHSLGCSSFSEYVVIPENSCVKVDPATNLKNGCIMACGFLTGYGSSTNAVQIKEGDKVGVWGLGGVGLACVVGCKKQKAAQIVGIDVNEEKQDIAKKFGCTDYVALSSMDPNMTMKQKIFGLTQLGLDYAFVCIGRSKALEDAISCLTMGGVAVLVGVTKSQEKITFTTNDLLATRSIKGTFFGDYNIFKDVPRVVKQYVDGQLPVDDFITSIFKLEQLNEAVDLMKQGKGIRSVVHF